MIYKLIYEYFKLNTITSYKKCTHTARNIISNKSLLEDTLANFSFKNEWYKKLNKKLKHHYFKFSITDIENLNNLYRVKVNRSRSFSYTTTSKIIHKSNNELFVFIISKINNKYEIKNIAYKEENPNFYEDLCTIKLEDLLSSILNVDFSWVASLKDINILYDNYKFLNKSIFYKTKFIKNKLYRYEYSSDSTLINNTKLIEYARKYALNYNENYNNFNNSGGDCTNFVSQALNFSGLNQNYKWQPYTASWIMVIPFRDYIINNHIAIEYNELCSNPVGTIIQFFSPVKKRFSHSGIITDIMDDGELLYCCHDYDKLDFPLSETYPVFYKQIRNLEIK